MLALIHRLVGPADALGCLVEAGVGGNAKGHGDLALLLAQGHSSGGDRLPQPLGNRAGISLLGPRQQDQKFFNAPACQQVLIAQAAF